jgi:hypothetical protein
LKIVSTLVDRELFLLKESSWTLLTVINDVTCFLETVDMVGAERQEDSARRHLAPVNTLKGMEDAGRVVHDTVGIDGDRECLITETLTDGIGKTRAHEENLFAGLYMEWGLVDGYLCAELHHFTW